LAFRSKTGALALLLTVGLFSCPVLRAQQPPTVEVLELKQLPQSGLTSGGWYTLRGAYELPSNTLTSMMELAFGVGPTQIIGAPQWAQTARYELVFKPAPGFIPPPGPVGFHQAQLLLRAVLADRFRLKFHREAVQEEARVLRIGVQGSRLQPSRPSAAKWHWKGIILKPGFLACRAAPIDEIAFIMSLSLGQPVVDQSGLHGLYDCEAHWQASASPLHRHQWIYDSGTAASWDTPFQSDSAPSSPTLEAALQDQLGLSLSSIETLPVEVLVVDDAQQPLEDLSTAEPRPALEQAAGRRAGSDHAP